MYWEEDRTKDTPFVVPDDVVDVAFRIRARSLPLDHAHALSEALHAMLPWLADDPAAGIHLIHGAESGNGWYRPDDPENEVLCPSRRTRLTLRLSAERVGDAEALGGRTLDIAGHALGVEAGGEVKVLSSLPTLFARYVVAPDPIAGTGGADDEQAREEAFLDWAVGELRALDIVVRKALCGRSHVMRTPSGEIHTRSLMLADLEPEESVRLQRLGIGPHRRMGCGLFIPHKGIKAVKGDDE
ncbi:MAG: type I-MYXAN CRISPR-associated protein Cas6/Cmx6 [Gammaproteobacteria bacterium]